MMDRHSTPAPETARAGEDPRGDALLVHAAAGDTARLAELRARVQGGEPAAYAAGCLYFRGRRFAIDSRAYITDPELSHLVDAVSHEGRVEAAQLGRALQVVEFGVGAGTLALSVKAENPTWLVAGVDVDAKALELARSNARALRLDVGLLESDWFSAWTATRPPPDLIFGDPPWGGEDDLYSPERDADYYRRMPARSAFPPGANGCAMHDELIQRIQSRGWRSLVILNYGVLPRALVVRSAGALRSYRLITPTANVTILIGRA